MTYSSRQRREINNEYELFSGFTGRKVIGFTDIESPPKKYIKRNINKSELPEESRGKKNPQASKSKSEAKSNISTQKTSESHHFREPLKTTNGQNKQLKINEKYDFDQCPSSPPKKKVTKHAAPLQGAVIQKVDYPRHKIKKQKKSPIKNNQENDLESQRLMELAAKYSQFLKERLSKNIENNSKPNNGNITDNNTATDNIQQQPTDKPIEKKRLVKFNDNIFKTNKSCLKKQGMSQNQNVNPNNCQEADGSKANDEKRCKKLVIEPTITYSVDTQEDMFDRDSNDLMQKTNNNVVPETNRKVEIEIKENHIETPRKPEVSNNTISDDNIEALNDDQQQNNSNDDDIGDDDDDFVNLVPKKPPVPTRYDLNELQEKNECNLKNTKLVENESDCDHEGFISLYDLMKKKNELEQRLNNTLESPNRFSSKPAESFNNSPVLDDADYVQLDMRNMQRATSTDENKEFSSKKYDKILINEDSLNPSDFFPKKRFFEMSDSDSENIASMTQSPKEKNDDNYPDVISSSPILSKIKDNIYSEPISNTSATKPIPRVTWDISNCPPPRARITNNFNHHIYDDDYNNDYSNNYHQEEVDLNSVTDFSKAIKLPKDFIINFNESEQSYETLDNNSFSNRKYGHDDDDDDDFYFQDEEDRNDCIPNFSRMLSFLRHKLDTKQLAEVVEVMNQNKSKHFVLSISTSSQKIDAVYVLRSDLKFARLIWGEGLSKVFQDDVAIFYQLNIASKRFEPLKITEFTPDFDAFLID